MQVAGLRWYNQHRVPPLESSMVIDFVHDLAGFDALAVEWDRLLSRSASVVPFLRHDYQRLWWSTLGGGEWSRGDLWIGVGRDSSGQALGIAPLFWGSSPAQPPALRLLGSIEISDYLDLIVPAEHADALARAVLDALASDGPERWTSLDLYNIPDKSPSLQALETAAAEHGWRSVQERLQPCPVIRLDADWETYLARLDKKQRHELRRKLRRAETNAEPVEMRLVEPGQDIGAAIETYLRLMATDPDKASFLTPTMRAHFAALIRTGIDDHWVQLAFLDVGGVPAAAYLNFDYAGNIWVYNSGLNPDFLPLSPGWVLLGRLIEWSIRNGRQEFDFLRGEEDYKFRLGGAERSICRLTLSR
jgi:CelD/BcsL family acetyltransferase involved in cellulose biosynthesis